MSNRQTRAVAKQGKHGVSIDVASQELPLPPPEFLKIYAEIHQETPERLLQQTEKNNEVIRQTTQKDTQLKLLRVILSFIATFCGLALASFLIYKEGNPYAIASIVACSFGFSAFTFFKK
jgi:uncharacterized membrane protein